MAADQFVPTDDFAEIKAIAMSDDDGPVLMVNLNKYAEGEYPDGAAYKEYMAALDILLAVSYTHLTLPTILLV